MAITVEIKILYVQCWCHCHKIKSSQVRSASKQSHINGERYFPVTVSCSTFQNNFSLSCRCLAAPFAPDLEIGPHLFAVTHDAKLVITAGHWDFSIRVFTAKAKLLQRLTYHNGKIKTSNDKLFYPAHSSHIRIQKKTNWKSKRVLKQTVATLLPR